MSQCDTVTITEVVLINCKMFTFQTGKSLVARGHYASSDINSRVNELFQQWKELGVATDRKGVGLQEALSLVLFNRKVDGVQSLIRDRVAVAGSQETGRDLEHCKVLMRKFDDFQTVREVAVITDGYLYFRMQLFNLYGCESPFFSGLVCSSKSPSLASWLITFLLCQL